MRQALVATLVELAERDPRVLVLTGDLGYTVLERFAERFPERFVNAGVAEQNLVGLATGLAESGFIPFVYSIVTFAVLRPYEFIRNGPIWHRLPVRFVGVGDGLAYALQGTSHYGLEDIGLMRVQPGLMVVAPADHEQTRTALNATWNCPGPIYYRLGKDDATVVPGLGGRFELGRAQLAREGRDVVMIATGSVAVAAARAAEALEAHGCSCALIVVASIRPAPVNDLLSSLARVPLVLTVEAHYVDGGLGSIVSELVAAHGLGCRVVRCGIEGPLDGSVGSLEYLHERHGLSNGLSSGALVRRTLDEIGSGRSARDAHADSDRRPLSDDTVTRRPNATKQ